MTIQSQPQDSDKRLKDLLLTLSQENPEPPPHIPTACQNNMQQDKPAASARARSGRPRALAPAVTIPSTPKKQLQLRGLRARGPLVVLPRTVFALRKEPPHGSRQHRGRRAGNAGPALALPLSSSPDTGPLPRPSTPGAPRPAPDSAGARRAWLPSPTTTPSPPPVPAAGACRRSCRHHLEPACQPPSASAGSAAPAAEHRPLPAGAVRLRLPPLRSVPPARSGPAPACAPPMPGCCPTRPARGCGRCPRGWRWGRRCRDLGARACGAWAGPCRAECSCDLPRGPGGGDGAEWRR